MDSARAVTRAIADFAAVHLRGVTRVCVGLSGGPDSLALTAGSVRAGLSVTALVVDHGLQLGSADVADAAADEARRLGADAMVLPVTVGVDGGLEAAARAARYAALDAARGGAPVLLGHTMDDQAETVLLGLGRGSGARSIAGMRAWSAPWGRPLLGVRRSTTLALCTELGLAPHTDPHNRDPRFTRVRLRGEVLPLLEDVLKGGVAESLSRTASALQADNDALDGYAEELAGRAATDTGLAVALLADAPDAVRTRVIRRWLLGVGATEPTARVIGAVDELVMRWRGQGGVAIGGDGAVRLEVARVGEVIGVERTPR
ncbi:MULTISPECIES: tRNA lysidine(34) synthetase TilS [unclassified Gordonia (in: high G+C Gram-positive bacteria)]|uniref:tRNA lysidine(34) synthetase TilS n=1 Tax=Gordonia sp. B7-2 TaxID=3420932 RepID=UPI003D93EF94